ncbi:MAG: 16S rRNA (uracil(1498)-N(3))-methyltransferase [Candidatus Omnitrophica bacterium]|nr:16S rRNA (uracil(1498)-N(3))-methyltransferase [Candidatus Omnitrophota bacterium]
MHRFYCTLLSLNHQSPVIDDPDEVHHLSRVLRLKAGDEVELIDGQGGVARVTLSEVSKSKVVSRLQAFERVPALSRGRIVLACALPKRVKFDDIIEKCTELGVDEIVPLITERTEVSPSIDAMSRMAVRFRKVVLSAAKQSKRLWFPKIHPVMPFKSAVDLFSSSSNGLFIPWLEGARKPLRETELSTLAFGKGNVVFFIGPEGDFSPQEAAYAIRRGATPVSLGETVLRVDTAAVAVIAYAHIGISLT